jgi:ribonuclease D
VPRNSKTRSKTPLSPPELVTDARLFAEHCDAWRAAGMFAFDTEFIRDDTYDAALCLIQVSCNGDVALIDPTADIDVTPFWELVADPKVVTVVHAGKEDFEVCLRSTGLLPRNIFDVQIAAGFVGYGYPLSLLRLVEVMLRKRIAKGQTLTDWLRRPLTAAQMRYAVEDVVHLPQLHKRLVAEIEKVGRTAWVREELGRFEDEAFYQAPVEERSLRLKGSRKLDGLGLAILRRLVDWRDEWARTRNRPIRALMRDDVLVDIARRRPRKESDLEVMRGFPQARNRKVIGELLKIIEEAAQIPRSALPKPQERREESPMNKAMVDLLSAMLQAVCIEEKLSRNLLGGAQRLRELIDYHAGRTSAPPELLQGWRREFIGDRLLALLDGRCEIHVRAGGEEPQISVVSKTTRRRKASS